MTRRFTPNNYSTFGSDGSQEPAETAPASATSENGPYLTSLSSPATPEADR